MPTAVQSLTPAAMDAIADEHFAAEGRADIPAILDTYSADVEFDVVGNPVGATRDRDAIRGFYSAIFSEMSDLRMRSLRRYYGADYMVDESLVTCEATGRPFGLEGKGRTINFRLLHV
ncbi:MAG TPA: nuclear transport factor 2 family protein, partial [Chloroflexota bacterium]|nr:nuclear transport factor 2 family protein [Chloroflexota bacterium]